MQTYQRLLTALLSVTVFPLLIYFSVGMVVQENILENFQDVGGKLLPGNIASARMMTELYHLFYTLEQYAAVRDIRDKKKIEALIADLDVHIATHMLYHNDVHNELENEGINNLLHRFSSFVSEYLLLIDKDVPQTELHQVRLKINNALDSFVSTINPLIDQELKESFVKLKESKQKSINVFRFLIGFGLLVICLSLGISYYISRRFRAVDKENENFKQNLESLVAKRTKQLHEKNTELESEILERKNIENELRNSERNLQSVLDSSIPICITDINFEILKANKSYCEVWPFSEAGIDKLKCYESRCGTLCHTELCPLKQIKNGQKEVIREVQKNDSEQPRDFIVTARPFYDNAGELIGIVESFQEITEWKKAEVEKIKLEKKLRQSQKMEAIGTLAGGIAHDFNNILSPIIGYSELLLMGRTADSTITKPIQEILTAANRAKELVKQILTFSRRSEQKLAPLVMQPVIKEALRLLRSSIPSSIEIQQNLNPECGAVLADPVQIHQIVMNLCTNAYQAITDQSGVISVSLTTVILAQADIASKVGLHPDHYLKLVVEDSGAGIDPESLKRIFEPYYTTKEKGKGTGLGLSVVHAIVNNYGGEINVYSELGKGTRFNIYLPVVSTETPQEKESREEPLQIGTEKLLLVDDEEQITQHAQIFLETLGYQVTSCNDPTEALSLFSNDPNRFDLVITDMTMPKMTGALLSQKLLTARKDLPIIMCTGFSETMDAETAKQFGIRSFLMKPVSNHDLAAIIRTVLDTK